MIQIVRKTNCLMFCVLLLSAMFINNLELHSKSNKSNLQGKSNNSSSQDKSKLDKALFAGGLVKSCMKALVDSMGPEFCWKEGGDAGKIPQGCPEGYFRHMALCYERCRGRYQYNGAGLCKDGWNSYIPSSITNFSDRATCDDGFYKSGALCYKDCENIGMFNCGIGACTSSKASCGTQIASMAIDTLVGAGQFVAFVLSMGASSATAPEVNAGRQATRQLTRQVTQTAWTRLKTSFNSFLKQTIERAKKVFIEHVKELPVGMSAEWVAENLCGEIYKGVAATVNGKSEPSSTDPVEVLKKFDIFGVAPIVENCGDSNKKAECSKAILNTAATFDPTGLLTIAAAFVHPTCKITMPNESKKDPKIIHNKPKSICTKCLQRMITSDHYGQGWVLFLDRHNVECPAGSALNYVYLSANPQNEKIGFDYRCIKDTSITTQCKDEYTQWNDFKYNEGSIQFLDRHNVECSNNNYVLQRFRLEAKWQENRIRFSYRCCMVNGYNFTNDYRTMPSVATHNWKTDSFNANDALDAGSNGALKGLRLRTDSNKFWYDYKISSWNGTGASVYKSETNWNDAGEGSLWFLDRHTVACRNSNSAIRAFWYERGGENFRYKYECVTHPKISNTCERRFTKLSDLDWDEYKSINFLDRQKVICYGDESMKSFAFQRVDNRLRYTFECCKTEYVSNYTTRWEKTDMGGKQNYYLDRQKVFLGVDEALRGFWMEVSYSPNLIWYAWEANVLN